MSDYNVRLQIQYNNMRFSKLNLHDEDIWYSDDAIFPTRVEISEMDSG